MWETLIYGITEHFSFFHVFAGIDASLEQSVLYAKGAINSKTLKHLILSHIDSSSVRSVLFTRVRSERAEREQKQKSLTNYLPC